MTLINWLQTHLRLQFSLNKVSMDSVWCQSSLWQSFGVWEEGAESAARTPPPSEPTGDVTVRRRMDQRTGRQPCPSPPIFTFVCFPLVRCHKPEIYLIVSSCSVLFHFSLVHYIISSIIHDKIKIRRPSSRFAKRSHFAKFWNKNVVISVCWVELDNPYY